MIVCWFLQLGQVWDTCRRVALQFQTKNSNLIRKWMENTNSFFSDETWWKFSSDFIRTVFPYYYMSMEKKNKLKPKPKKKHAPKTKLHCSNLDIKATFVQPFCFCSHEETKDSYKKGNEINLCKGETKLWEGEASPCQREEHLCKEEANLCKGEAIQKSCVPERNLEKRNLQKLGQLPLQNKIKKSQKPMMMSMKQLRSCNRVWPQQKKTGLVPNTKPTSTRMAMRKKELHSTMHPKMKRESWRPFS